eukprot:NODE_1230_length_1043_cov_60.807847_g942_i0.p2 GENE.NODE_1230_length_1043_cov_60.807847_g942_i0~~NODE_1230_length_1043_cov_60.807847_g942_i0.p2  ORF type:complete len:94 (-),score=19.22 NODE_1230_length_1043_cov_60.807847_g942_i0:195-476(-)
MCDELGDESNMQAYVEEKGSTSLCSAVTKSGCSAKEGAYIDKMSVKPHAEIQQQLTRLEGMKDEHLKADLKEWKRQRTAILKQLSRQDSKEEL